MEFCTNIHLKSKSLCHKYKRKTRNKQTKQSQSLSSNYFNVVVFKSHVKLKHFSCHSVQYSRLYDTHTPNCATSCTCRLATRMVQPLARIQSYRKWRTQSIRTYVKLSIDMTSVVMYR